MAETGDQVRLEIGPVAHGGSCVARFESRVVFVRHALPGEVVLAVLTDADETARFWRADAVEVLQPSPDRVAPRCAVSGPGGCGGCDWQHVSVDGQRRLKAAVVVEQLHRLGKRDDAELAALWPQGLVVEPVPGDVDGLGWRSRVRFTIDGAGRPGMFRHRTHEVVPVAECPIARPQLNAVGVGRTRWPHAFSVEVVVGDSAQQDEMPLVVVEADGATGTRDIPPLAVPVSLARRSKQGLQRVRGRTWVGEQVEVDGVPRAFRVSGGGFWQVHPGAAQTLLDAVLAAAQPRPGERAVDLYSGVGLFTAGLALRVGDEGRVMAVELDPRGAQDARRSLHDLPQVQLEAGTVERVLPQATQVEPWSGSADVVVLDPPRAGAGRAVVTSIAALSPRVVVYVACDPAALGRDVNTFAGLGYRLSGLRAFDTFPLTHHVECVATFTPDSLRDSYPASHPDPEVS